jgi:23S rRNA (cytidine2498-2'-O)-methyltransferase
MAWLKRDVARAHPELAFAFSRPGLVTFKLAEGPLPAGFRLETPFARASGESLGRAHDAEEALALLLPLSERTRLRLHVFERDPRHEPKDAGARAGTRAEALRAELLRRAPARFLEDPIARAGDVVADVVVAPAAEPDEPLLVGHHVHEEGGCPFPGGAPKVTPPPEAPSRAFAKIEEAILWSGLVPREGEIAVEIGASPGGASYALLLRGLTVFGIDPADMDPRVLSFGGAAEKPFHHVRAGAGGVGADELPARADFLLSDVNLAPPVALRYVERILKKLLARPRGAFLTLKLNDDRMLAEVPRFVRRVRDLGLGPTRATQLPSHGQEIVVVTGHAAFRG